MTSGFPLMHRFDVVSDVSLNKMLKTQSLIRNVIIMIGVFVSWR